MIKLNIEKDIILFYHKQKWDFVEDYSKKSISGFYAWYTRLVQALKSLGYNVYENDYDLASANPEYPVGLVGTPSLLENWELPNPVVLGPCMYDNPRLNPSLMDDPRFRLYLLTSEWFKRVFEEVYLDKCRLWFAGIPLDEWPDTKNNHKSIDVLIYDKIRWGGEAIRPLFLEPIKAYLEKNNLHYQVLQYGDISHEMYRNYLSKSKSMLFLCESETQGMAYQEALASNVPVLAWDPGWWVDPVWLVFSTTPIPASSVPYFSPECGERFDDVRDFQKTFDLFWNNLDKYEPRQFVKNNLSLEKSGRIYADYYFGLLK
jgi:glycosyltransferase involved in cell wall biosynthesis